MGLNARSVGLRVAGRRPSRGNPDPQCTARKNRETPHQLLPMMPNCGKDILRVFVRIIDGGSDQQHSAVRLTVAKHEISKVLVSRKKHGLLPARKRKHF